MALDAELTYAHRVHPKVAKNAAELWANIPADRKKSLLSNLWSRHCHREVTIRNFTGAVKAGNLLLVGVCSECRGDMASRPSPQEIAEVGSPTAVYEVPSGTQ